MLKIRENVFETNSSSCHSLVINDNTTYNTISCEDVLEIQGGEYGWGYEKLTSAIEKLNYVAVLLETLREKKNSTYEASLKVWANENYDKCYENYTEVVINQTGTNKIKNLFKINWTNNGTYAYIDHQSCESVGDFDFLLNKQKIKDLIFGKSSYIIIDNDNH